MVRSGTSDSFDNLCLPFLDRHAGGRAKTAVVSIYRAWDPKPGTERWQRRGVPLHLGAERTYRELGLIQ